MSKQEKRNCKKNVHVYLGFLRRKFNKDSKPREIRRIAKSDEDLEILKRELEAIGGYWRVHRTVNMRSTEKAFKLLQHYMIDHPDCASYLDSVWKTMLLQKGSSSERKFMLDIDFKCENKLKDLKDYLDIKYIKILESVETPNGYHYITMPFNRSEFIFDDVTVLNDGYIFIGEVGKVEND